MRQLYRLCLVMALLLGGLDRALAQATILQAPVELLDQLLGGNCSFSVVAQSAATTNLAYQWLRNGVAIPGATNSSLSLPNAQPTDCGAFSVVVDDGVVPVETDPVDLTLDIQQLLGVLNFLDALTLTNSGVRSSNLGVTSATNSPEIIPGDPGGSTVWFKWSPPLLSQGVVTFSTLGSDFDTIMGAYTSNANSNLVPVPSAVNDDDSAGYLCSKISFNAAMGATYLIAVDGYFGAQGNIVISWDLQPSAPTLPTFAGVPTALTVSNGATLLLPSPWASTACDWLQNGVVVATNVSSLTLSNFNSTQVGNYVARIDNSIFSEPIRIEINSQQNGVSDSNSVAWNKLMDAATFTSGPPVFQARKMGGGDGAVYSTSQVFSTKGNETEPGQPAVCNQTGSAPGWFTYVAPSTGTLLVNTAGSSFNTILGVFVGDPSNWKTMTNIGCGYTTSYQSFGQPSVTIPNLAAKQTNYIEVMGENGASGTVSLNIALGTPVAFQAAPQNQAAAPGETVILTAGGTGSTPLYYSWQFNGQAMAGQDGPTLTLSNFQAAQAGTYTVTLSNQISTLSAQSVVTLASPPTITAPPSSHSVPPNGTGQLAVSANGNPPPAFLWTFNGCALTNPGSALSIANFQASNQGAYNVVVSNTVGVVTSGPAFLMLNQPCRISSWGLSNGGFQLQLVCGEGSNMVVQTSSNLQTWTPLFTNTNGEGVVNFNDTNGAVQQFYRAVTP